MSHITQREAFEAWHGPHGLSRSNAPGDDLDGYQCSHTNMAWKAWQAALAQPEPHSDDIAVDAMAAAMKEKLAQARAKGRGGWETCSQQDLSRMLREHVEKGDPRDVANFCAFLYALGFGIEKTEPVVLIGKVESAAVACRGFHVVLAEGATMPKIGDLILTAAKKPAKGGAL